MAITKTGLRRRRLAARHSGGGVLVGRCSSGMRGRIWRSTWNTHARNVRVGQATGRGRGEGVGGAARMNAGAFEPMALRGERGAHPARHVCH